MATDFSSISADAQNATTLKEAVSALLTGLADMIAATGDAATLGADLAAQAGNLARACAHNVDGSAKPAGGLERAQYLEAAGL